MSAVTVPAGFVLVPDEPTPAMIEAFSAECEKTGSSDATCFRAMIAARPAITAGTDAGAVKVKLLEWQEESGEYTAITVVGWYHIGRPASKWNVLTPPAEIHSFETLAEAKALAQADYERRILSALTPETAEAGPVEPDCPFDGPVHDAEMCPVCHPKAWQSSPTAEAAPVAAQPGEAVREAAREALKPFAAFADALSESVPDKIALGILADGAMHWGPTECCVGDLRRARAALASVPAPAVATEPVAWAYEWAPFGHESWEAGVSLSDPLVHGGVRRYCTVRPLYAHLAPEDTARLREELERTKLNLSNAHDRIEGLLSDHAAEKHRADTALAQLDDVRRKIRTAREDEREACAILSEEWDVEVPGYCERADSPAEAGACFASEKIAELIRARSAHNGSATDGE